MRDSQGHLSPQDGSRDSDGRTHEPTTVRVGRIGWEFVPNELVGVVECVVREEVSDGGWSLAGEGAGFFVA